MLAVSSPILVLLFSALLVGGASTFVSCKDTESDALYDSNGKVAEVIAKQAKDISDLAGKLAQETKDRKDADQVFTDFINGKAVQIKETADKAWAQAQENKTKIGELTANILGLQEQLRELLGLAGRVDGLEGRVSDLESKFESFKSCECDLTELNRKYTELKNQQELDRARIQAIEDGKTDLDTELGRINTTLNGKVDQTTFNELKEKVYYNTCYLVSHCIEQTVQLGSQYCLQSRNLSPQCCTSIRDGIINLILCIVIAGEV